MKFQPGVSGNPKGRPPGRGPVVQYRELLHSRAEPLINRLVEDALAGEPTALRICIERLIPPYKAESLPITLPLPEAAPLTQLGETVLQAVGSGTISPEQGGALLRIHARIAAARLDFLHKTTTEIIRRADVIALEDLHVKGMMRNHHLAGAIADVGMHEFRRQIEYKAAWYSRQVRFADRWAPTSKTCSECGQVNDTLPRGLRGLRVRKWTCECGAHHDRDVNAAKNILKFSTAGNAGINARGVGKNLSGHVPGTHDESRTNAEKFTVADRMDRAA